MEKEHSPEKPAVPEPPPASGERADVHVVASRSRCPFCHGEISPDVPDWVVCKECLARHHLNCWGENGRCATCGRSQFLPADSAREGSSGAKPRSRGKTLRFTKLPLVPAILMTGALGILMGLIFAAVFGLAGLVFGLGTVGAALGFVSGTLLGVVFFAFVEPAEDRAKAAGARDTKGPDA
jgi:hypothetical protein